MLAEQGKRFRAECDKAGVVVYLKAHNKKDAEDKLISSAAYWQANKRYKTKLSDWKIEKEG